MSGREPRAPKAATEERRHAEERRQHHGPSGGKRRQAREMALQMLYQREVGDCPLPEVFRRFDLHLYGTETSAKSPEKGSDAAFVQACALVEGVSKEVGELDRQISSRAENWRIERMPVVDRNILRLGVYQLLRELDVPGAVVIDEAIELAKKFGSERSSAFVNGLLDALLKRLRPDEVRDVG